MGRQSRVWWKRADVSGWAYAAPVTTVPRSKPFRELAALIDAEFAARGMPLKPDAAEELLGYRVQHVADQMGITPASALKYFSEDNVRDIARNTARIVKEHEATQGARPPVQLTPAQAGLVISAFTVAARIGVVNGDPDVAADLCEVITAIAMELQHEPSIEISTLLLRNGINWARLPTEKLADGTWAVLPGKTPLDVDQGVATRLQLDLDTIERLLG